MASGRIEETPTKSRGKRKSWTVKKKDRTAHYCGVLKIPLECLSRYDLKRVLTDFEANFKRRLKIKIKRRRRAFLKIPRILEKDTGHKQEDNWKVIIK